MNTSHETRKRTSEFNKCKEARYDFVAVMTGCWGVCCIEEWVDTAKRESGMRSVAVTP